MKSTKKIGDEFEKYAMEHLQKQNIEILTKNYYSKFGEIDIIGKEKDTIIFIEVKYRKNNKFGNSLEAITIKKQERIFKTAIDYIYKNNYTDFNYRFDAIGIDGTDIKWIKNIFWKNDKWEIND